MKNKHHAAIQQFYIIIQFFLTTNTSFKRESAKTLKFQRIKKLKIDFFYVHFYLIKKKKLARM